jgi:chromosome segregation ATPase
LLPPAAPRLSLFTDAGEAELQRLDAQSGEVLRLDGLLAQRDRELSALTASLQALEAQAADARLLIGEHEAQLTAAKAALAGTEAARAAERDAARAELAGTLARLERALAERDDAHASLGSERQAVASLTEETARLSRAVEAQERIVAYRQSARWWLALPWLRLRLLWRRWRG